MSTLNLILADQLFEHNPCIGTKSDIVMIESLYEAKRLKYHKFKLAYIFTTMREYADYIRQLGTNVIYFELEQELDFETALTQLVKSKGYTRLQTTNINDKFFARMLKQICANLKLELVELDSPMFLYTKPKFQSYLDSKSTKGLLLNNFYIHVRKDLKILVTADDKPVGGQWSFDSDNRSKLPKVIDIPARQEAFESSHYKTVSNLINKYFPDNPGILSDQSHFGVNHSQAKNALDFFITNCLDNFGTYQDALTDRSELVFHSVISPYLNNGLLTPQQVLDTLDKYLKNNYNYSLYEVSKFFNNHFELNNIEGFIRQLIGWREWVKGLYDNVYDEDINQYNFWNHTKNLPEYFYYPSKFLSKTNLQLQICHPKLDSESNQIDDEIQEFQNNIPLQLALLKVENLAYNHHIERLMVIANWCTLNEYNPRQVFDWFVEMYVDSADWVMVANVLGMGIFADGGIFATKPYISGGNYIKKMSDYKDVKIWEPIWTDKFWAFLFKHETYFAKNPRLNMLIKSKKNNG